MAQISADIVKVAPLIEFWWQEGDFHGDEPVLEISKIDATFEYLLI